MKYKFVKSDFNDIYWNFALEEYMLDTVDENEFIFYVWVNSPSVLIGRNQNIYSECNLKAVEEDKIDLVRRRSGGGAVYFDLGGITYSFITQRKNYNVDFNFQFIIDSLKRCGFFTEKSGRNDILYKGKKISGNAFYNDRKKYLHHGTILYNVNIGDMSKYLKVSKKKLESKGVRSVSSRVTNLIEYSPTMKIDEIINAFYEQLSQIAGTKLKITTLKDLLQSNKELQKYYDKHRSNDWIFGKNPDFNHEFEERFDWGSIDIRLFVKDNKIKEAKIYTDALYPDYFEKLDKVLIDTEYKVDNIIAAIEDKIDYDKLEEDVEGFKDKVDKIKEDIFSLIRKSI